MPNRFKMPSPNIPYPISNIGTKIGFLKNLIKRKNIVVGDYTYYQDYENAANFEKRNVIFHSPAMKDKLIIGKFCQIGNNAQFVMNASHYRYHSFTAYPFEFMIGNEIENVKFEIKFKGDTVVGNDVLIGYKALILPGVHIGNGAIIGARAVVTKDVPPYTVVTGNPAEVRHKRFSDEAIEILEKLEWWNWNIEEITRSIHILASDNIESLKELAEMKKNNLV